MIKGDDKEKGGGGNTPQDKLKTKKVNATYLLVS
jgi:hypothetical protein